MSVTHALTIGVMRRGVRAERTFPVTAGKEIVVDEQVPYNSGNPQTVAVAIARAKLQSFVMVADRDLEVVANANRTFSLEAGKPVVYYDGIGIDADTFLDSLDIASLSVTNSTGLTARFQLWAVIDPT